MPLHTKLITSKVSQLFIPSLNTEVHTSKVNTKLLKSLKSLFVIPNEFKVFLIIYFFIIGVINFSLLYLVIIVMPLFCGERSKENSFEKRERETKLLYNSCDKTFILASST